MATRGGTSCAAPKAPLPIPSAWTTCRPQDALGPDAQPEVEEAGQQSPDHGTKNEGGRNSGAGGDSGAGGAGQIGAGAGITLGREPLGARDSLPPRQVR